MHQRSWGRRIIQCKGSEAAQGLLNSSSRSTSSSQYLASHRKCVSQKQGGFFVWWSLCPCSGQRSWGRRIIQCKGSEAAQGLLNSSSRSTSSSQYLASHRKCVSQKQGAFFVWWYSSGQSPWHAHDS